MKRSAIQINKTTLAVTLPKKWVDNKHLKKGNELSVEENEEGQLVIGGDERAEKIIEFKVMDEPINVLRSQIGTYYRLGYNEMHIRFDNETIGRKLQSVSETFLGLELLDVTEKSCVMKTLFELEVKDIEKHILKMMQVGRTAFDIVIESLQTGKFVDNEIQQMNTIGLKQRDLIHRTIMSTNVRNPKIFPYYTIASNIHQVIRSLTKLFALKKKLNPTLLKDTKKLFDKLLESIEEHNYDIHKLELNLTKEINEKISKNPIVGGYCLRIIPFIQMCNSPLTMLRVP